MRPLAVAGNVNVDLIMGTLPPWPTPGTEVFVDHDEMRAGGAAGNVALAWRALALHFQVAGNLGNDQFGRFLRTTFVGIPRALASGVDARTTISVGLTHPDGERTFITTEAILPSSMATMFCPASTANYCGRHPAAVRRLPAAPPHRGLR